MLRAHLVFELLGAPVRLPELLEKDRAAKPRPCRVRDHEFVRAKRRTGSESATSSREI